MSVNMGDFQHWINAKGAFAAVMHRYAQHYARFCGGNNGNAVLPEPVANHNDDMYSPAPRAVQFYCLREEGREVSAGSEQLISHQCRTDEYLADRLSSHYVAGYVLHAILRRLMNGQPMPDVVRISVPVNVENLHYFMVGATVELSAADKARWQEIGNEFMTQVRAYEHRSNLPPTPPGNFIEYYEHSFKAFCGLLSDHDRDSEVIRAQCDGLAASSPMLSEALRRTREREPQPPMFNRYNVFLADSLGAGIRPGCRDFTARIKGVYGQVIEQLNRYSRVHNNANVPMPQAPCTFQVGNSCCAWTLANTVIFALTGNVFVFDDNDARSQQFYRLVDIFTQIYDDVGYDDQRAGLVIDRRRGEIMPIIDELLRLSADVRQRAVVADNAPAQFGHPGRPGGHNPMFMPSSHINHANHNHSNPVNPNPGSRVPHQSGNSGKGDDKTWLKVLLAVLASLAVLVGIGFAIAYLTADSKDKKNPVNKIF